MQAEYNAEDSTLCAPLYSFKVRGVLIEEGLEIEVDDPVIAITGGQPITSPVKCKILEVHAQPDQSMCPGDLIATIALEVAVAVEA